MLGVRPEDFSISSGPVSGGLSLNLVIDAVERVGPETFVYGTRAHEGAARTVSAKPGELPPGEIIVRLPGEAVPVIGERIQVTASRTKLHLFSPDGRRRIDN